MNYRRLFIQNTYVFLTIVTARRRKILIENINILRNAFRKTIDSFSYEIFAICILHDHIHCIIKPLDINDYPKIIQQMKRYFSQKINKNLLNDYQLTDSNIKRKECNIWQHRFFEHTIRDENDLNKHIDYIHFNSMKHYNIKPKNWEFSSFKKFVKNGYYDINWCNWDDKNNINFLNYE